MNPAFAIGQQVGTNFAKARQESQDVGIIDKILSDSMKTNDPNVLQNNIGAILRGVSPERQPAAIKFIESRMQNIQKQQEAKALKDLNIPPNLPAPIAKEYYKQAQKNEALQKYGIVNGQNQPQPMATQEPRQIQPQQVQQQQQFVPGMQLTEEGTPATYRPRTERDRARRNEW
jgi:hypothetical protein